MTPSLNSVARRPTIDQPCPLRLITYNIMSAGSNNLNMVLRAMDVMHVALGILTETKLTHDMYTKDCCDYSVVSTKAVSPHHQGGVALFFRSVSNQFAVEGIQTHGPNVHWLWALVVGI
jgi:hypothetical protein